MEHDSVNLAALIGSRICHDLINPIGAINNGLELLDMAGGSSGPELELISDSVENAAARIRFFRIAYGAPSAQLLGQPEIAAVLRDISAASRITFEWAPSEAQERTLVRLAFLAMQCCETAMPYGGTVRAEVVDQAWIVTGRTDTATPDAALWQALGDGTAEAPVAPATVQFALLPELVKQAGRSLTAQWSEDELSLRF